MILIERSIPMPVGREDNVSVLGELRLALMAMKVGEHFTKRIDHARAYLAAKSIGARIKTVKLNNGERIVWLAEKAKRMTLKPEEVARLCAKFGITRNPPLPDKVVESAARHKRKHGRRMRRIADAGNLTWRDEV